MYKEIDEYFSINKVEILIFMTIGLIVTSIFISLLPAIVGELILLSLIIFTIIYKIYIIIKSKKKI